MFTDYAGFTYYDPGDTAPKSGNGSTVFPQDTVTGSGTVNPYGVQDGQWWSENYPPSSARFDYPNFTTPYGGTFTNTPNESAPNEQDRWRTGTLAVTSPTDRANFAAWEYASTGHESADTLTGSANSFGMKFSSPAVVTAAGVGLWQWRRYVIPVFVKPFASRPIPVIAYRDGDSAVAISWTNPFSIPYLKGVRIDRFRKSRTLGANWIFDATVGLFLTPTGTTSDTAPLNQTIDYSYQTRNYYASSASFGAPVDNWYGIALSGLVATESTPVPPPPDPVPGSATRACFTPPSGQSSAVKQVFTGLASARRNEFY